MPKVLGSNAQNERCDANAAVCPRGYGIITFGCLSAWADCDRAYRLGGNSQSTQGITGVSIVATGQVGAGGEWAVDLPGENLPDRLLVGFYDSDGQPLVALPFSLVGAARLSGAPGIVSVDVGAASPTTTAAVDVVSRNEIDLSAQALPALAQQFAALEFSPGLISPFDVDDIDRSVQIGINRGLSDQEVRSALSYSLDACAPCPCSLGGGDDQELPVASVTCGNCPAFRPELCDDVESWRRFLEIRGEGSIRGSTVGLPSNVRLLSCQRRENLCIGGLNDGLPCLGVPGECPLGFCGDDLRENSPELGRGPEQIYRWTVDRSGLWRISTCSSDTDYDTILYVSQDLITPGVKTNLSECRDDIAASCSFNKTPQGRRTGCGPRGNWSCSSEITACADEGDTRYIYVDGWGENDDFAPPSELGHQGDYVLELERLGACPIAGAEPEDPSAYKDRER